jgi:hypothetical protein
MIEPQKVLEEIINILEERDEVLIRNALFESFTKAEDIKTELQKRLGIDINLQALNAWLNSLWVRREIVKVRAGRFIGYRSRIGEVLRYLYKLKLWTIKGERERIYEDTSQIKYVRVPKNIPERIRPVDQLIHFFNQKKFAKFLFNPFNINPAEVVCEALKRCSFKYEKLSDFQLRSCRMIAWEWIKEKPNHFVITAATGAGKTLAFLITPLIFCVADKLQKPTMHETKLMLVYPRNALALNQTQLIEELVIHINSVLKDKFNEKRLTIAPPQLKNPLTDFGGLLSMPGREHLEEAYKVPHEILITNTETLKRRMMDPIFQKVTTTLRCCIFDEIHIYEGLHGTNIIFLIRRLKGLVRKASNKDVLLIGSSATIAEPEQFAKTLFSTDSVKTITPLESELSPSGKEHHIFLRPYPNRSPLSVAIDATSCLLHTSRKNGLSRNKLESNVESVEKGIGFADSLDIVNRWRLMLANNEKSIKSRRRLTPNYARFFRPNKWIRNNAACQLCEKDGVDLECKYHRNGQCWFLMAEDPYDENSVLKTDDGSYVRLDAIWTNAYTAKTELAFEERNVQQKIFGYRRPPPNFVDFVVATTALEVGVDFNNVREILLYRALKSPSSYRQRAGRAGRELGSDCLIGTVISTLPNELYYFRHYMNLVTPSFQPVPVKALNLEVIRNHMLCALFDFIAANGVDIWSVVANPDFYNNIEKAKSIARSEDAKRYLSFIYNDEVFIEEATENLIKVLDAITSKEVFEIIGVKEPFVDIISKLLKDQNFYRNVETSLWLKKSHVQLILDLYQRIKNNKADCYDCLKDLNKYPDIQRSVLEILRKIDEMIL